MIQRNTSLQNMIMGEVSSSGVYLDEPSVKKNITCEELLYLLCSMDERMGFACEDINEQLFIRKINDYFDTSFPSGFALCEGDVYFFKEYTFLFTNRTLNGPAANTNCGLYSSNVIFVDFKIN